MTLAEELRAGARRYRDASPEQIGAGNRDYFDGIIDALEFAARRIEDAAAKMRHRAEGHAQQQRMAENGDNVAQGCYRHGAHDGCTEAADMLAKGGDHDAG